MSVFVSMAGYELLVPMQHLLCARCCTEHVTVHLTGSHSSARSQVWLTQFYSKKKKKKKGRDLYFYLCPTPNPRCNDNMAFKCKALVYLFIYLFPLLFSFSGIVLGGGQKLEGPWAGKGSISTNKMGKHPGRLFGEWKWMWWQAPEPLPDTLGRSGRDGFPKPSMSLLSICQGPAGGRETLQRDQTSQGSLKAAGGAQSGRDASRKDLWMLWDGQQADVCLPFWFHREI